MRTHCQEYFEREIDQLLNRISATAFENKKRQEAFNFVKNAVKRCLPSAYLFGSGSTFLLTYLSCSDVDLVLITDRCRRCCHSLRGAAIDAGKLEMSHKRDESHEADVLASLFTELFKMSDTSSKDSWIRSSMKNIQFINARTKLLRCTSSNGLDIDITVNRPGSLATVAFLEEVDRVIGHHHLFKKSILLVKAWCVYESSLYNVENRSILGSKSGMLNSYGLSILVLHLFNRYTENFLHPMSVLRCFFHLYCRFPWESFVMTIEGPIPIQRGNLKSSISDPLSYQKMNRTANRFTSLIEKFSGNYSNSVFPIRCCNIQDPIDRNNNLGLSVTSKNLNLIDSTLKGGCVHLDRLLADFPSQSFVSDAFLSIFFPVLYNLLTNGKTHFSEGCDFKNSDIDHSKDSISLDADVANLLKGHYVASTGENPTSTNDSENSVSNIEKTIAVCTKYSENCQENISEDICMSSSEPKLEIPSLNADNIDLKASSNLILCAVEDKEARNNIHSILLPMVRCFVSQSDYVNVTDILCKKHFKGLLIGRNLFYEWLVFSGELHKAILDIIAHKDYQIDSVKMSPDVECSRNIEDMLPGLLDILPHADSSLVSAIICDENRNHSDYLPPSNIREANDSCNAKNSNYDSKMHVIERPSNISCQHHEKESSKITQNSERCRDEDFATYSKNHDVHSYVELQPFYLLYSLTSLAPNYEDYNDCQPSELSEKVEKILQLLVQNFMKFRNIYDRISMGKLNIIWVVLSIVSAVVSFFLLHTSDVSFGFVNRFFYDDIVTYFYITSMKIFSEYSILNSYIGGHEEGSRCQYHDDDMKLGDLASTVWISRGSKIILHGGISIPANYTLCKSVIHAFGINDADFCADMRPVHDHKQAGHSVNVEYRWFRDEHVLANKDGPYLILDDHGVANSRYIGLRLNLTKPKKEAIDIINIYDVKIPKPPLARNKGSLLQFRVGEYMKIIVPGVEGNPEPVYQWYKNGFTVENANERTYVISHVNKTHAGTYSCRLRNIAGEYVYAESTVIIHD